MGGMSLDNLIYELTMIQAYVKFCTMDKTEQAVILSDLEEVISDLKENGIES